MYKKLRLKDRLIDEHRFIMEQATGRRLTRHEVVHHDDENKQNNDPSNLKVMSLSDHSRMHMTGRSLSADTKNTLRKIGIATMHVNKLNENQVREIKASLPFNSRNDLARKYNVSKAAIHDIALGRTWSHI